MKKLGVILILLSFFLFIVGFVMADNYNPRRGFVTNIRDMKINIITQKKQPKLPDGYVSILSPTNQTQDGLVDITDQVGGGSPTRKKIQPDDGFVDVTDQFIKPVKEYDVYYIPFKAILIVALLVLFSGSYILLTDKKQ